MASTAPALDPGFALAEDGSARDPQAFQAALRADPSKLAAIEADEALKEVILGDDTGPLQDLLRSIFQVGCSVALAHVACIAGLLSLQPLQCLPLHTQQLLAHRTGCKRLPDTIDSRGRCTRVLHPCN